MRVYLYAGEIAQLPAEALVVTLAADRHLDDAAREVDRHCGGRLSHISHRVPHDVPLLLLTQGRIPIPRVVLVHAGDDAEIDTLAQRLCAMMVGLRVSDWAVALPAPDGALFARRMAAFLRGVAPAVGTNADRNTAQRAGMMLTFVLREGSHARFLAEQIKGGALLWRAPILEKESAS